MPATADELYGCVQNNIGNLRMVQGPGDCKRTETLVSWNAEGQQGEQGIQGAPGPQGPAGPIGPEGPQQSNVVMDANGLAFGKVISLGAWAVAYVLYQWQGYDLMLEITSNSPRARGNYISNFYHTKSDCSDTPWFDANLFNNSNDVTITGDTFEKVTTTYDINTNTFKIVGPANPGQTPATITAVAQSYLDGTCTGFHTPRERTNMIQGIVDLTPAFGDEHPSPYTVISQ